MNKKNLKSSKRLRDPDRRTSEYELYIKITITLDYLTFKWDWRLYSTEILFRSRINFYHIR